MSADTISIRSPWPTNVAGQPDVSPAAQAELHARIDRLTDAQLETVCQSRHGESLAEHGGQFGPDYVRASHGRRFILSQLHSAVDEAVFTQHETVPYFDGLRWWAVLIEQTHGEASSEFGHLELLAASDICVDPTDGDQFRDVAAIAASVAVLDTVAEAARRALAVTGLTAEQQSAVEAALEDARNDVLGTARTIRHALIAAGPPALPAGAF